MAKRREFGYSGKEMEELLGHEAAEQGDEQRLLEFFFQPTLYNEINDGSRLRILIAHKGVGKSTLLRVCRLRQQLNGQRTIEIKPHDIVSIPVDTHAKFVKKIVDWRQGLRRLVLLQLAKSGDFKIDSSTEAALSAVANNFELPLLDAVTKAVSILPAHVHRSLLSMLQGDPVTIYIDDLDLGWQYGAGTTHDIERIATLFAALREMVGEKNLHFRTAIRTDIYYLISRAYVDVGKLRGDCRWFRWDNRSILAMFVKRVLTYRVYRMGEQETLDLRHDEQRLLDMTNGKLSTYLAFLLDPIFKSDVAWHGASMYKVLITMIRKRPRDMVFLLAKSAECMRARVASDRMGNSQARRILGQDILKALPTYSLQLLNETIVEYQGEFPAIKSLLANMAPSRQEVAAGEGFVFSTQNIIHKLKYIIDNNLLSIEKSEKDAGEHDAATLRMQRCTAEDLLTLLFRINFLTTRIRHKTGSVHREYFDESRFDATGLAGVDGVEWEIHPAYRLVLLPGQEPDLTHLDSVALVDD